MNAALGNFRLTNYHSHTTRCGHAEGTEEGYVQQAIRYGYDVLGFADHSAWPCDNDYVGNIRMRIEELDGYIGCISDLRDRYGDRIELLTGMECEAYPEFYPWLEKTRKRMDFLILGSHYDRTGYSGRFYFGNCKTPEQVRHYADITIAGMESGLFVYLAHPDLYCCGYPRFDSACEDVAHRICEASLRLNMPLEYNLHGLERHESDQARGGVGYSIEPFWRIAAQKGCRIILGLDAHETASFSRLHLYRHGRALLQGMGANLIDDLDEYLK